MLDELRRAASRQRAALSMRALVAGCKRLLSERGETNSMAISRLLIERLDALHDEQLSEFFDYLARELSPDPQKVLRAAQRYLDKPDATHQVALTRAAEPPRQELLRRLNRTPGGTAALVRMRRQLLRELPKRPELIALEADMLHLLTSWFNPGFLQMKRVDWNSPAQLLEKIIHHEAVHAVDGWDDLRRRLQPDRRCFAFFHPQLPDEPLIFVEVALLPEMPAAIAPLIDKSTTPLAADRFRVAAFYSISNCEPGLRNVSLGNFLIKSVAVQLERELPRLRSFCTLSPVPGFAAWLLGEPDFSKLPNMRRNVAADFDAARDHLRQLCDGDLGALRSASTHDKLDKESEAALLTLCSAYLLRLSPTPAGDPVARFHLDNGARLERLNPRANMSPNGAETVLRRDGQLPVRPEQGRSQPRQVRAWRGRAFARSEHADVMAHPPGNVTRGDADAHGVARLCIRNPGKLNALSVSMWQQLRAAVEPLNEAPGAVRVLLVHGADGQFAAGGDIEEFPDFRFDEQRLRHFHEDIVAPALRALLDCELPLVAQIDGACVGGGLEIAACCDLRICGSGSRFGLPIARLGFPLAPGEAELVSRVLPLPLLRELLLEARLLGAEEACTRGIVNRVVADAQVAAEAQASAERIAALSLQAHRLNKITLRQLARGPVGEAERHAHFGYADSVEHREGLAAFIDKRPPRFK